ncbi:MAG: SMC-Scp complex subunit ScpB [Candidatus Poseidoniaceae archaeon]|nr:SMC-Scp complex subunit ScpB [Candidatus Poseidoniaceae archaeon]
MAIELETLIEATLFGAGRSMSVEELAVDLEVEAADIATSLEALRTSLKRRRGGALQLAEINGRWALEVKPKVAQHLPCNAKTDIPPKLLKSASLIAFHQPMMQSRLVELLGQRTYDHVRELVQLGLVERRRHGNTKRLSTTRRFSEVFGCPHTEKRKVRAWFREQAAGLGLTSGGGERPMALNEDQTELPVEDENIFEAIADRASEHEEGPAEPTLEPVAEEIEAALEE